MKLAQWARSQGIHPQTAYRWFREGKMPVPARRLSTGTIVVDGPAAQSLGGAVLYARVSSHGETTDDLVRGMIEVLTSMCARLYGRRGARNRALRALTAAQAADRQTS
ncbi:hypothetical protein [Streptosporangium sp. NPDC000396]|uniref:hypothetical protein n=1 Tax=Streptosporangium sp. NPDC000396 TaxID=3366185 RepID=UPI00369E2B7B